jgi:hypothetical protein
MALLPPFKSTEKRVLETAFHRLCGAHRCPVSAVSITTPGETSERPNAETVDGIYVALDSLRLWDPNAHALTSSRETRKSG